MNNIIDKCMEIYQITFPYNQYNTITDFVTNITKELGMPFSAYQTNEKNKNYVFKCTFNGRRSDKHNCPACLVFTKDSIDKNSSFTFNYIDSITYHNHSEAIDFYNAHRNMLDESQKIELKNQCKLGVPPGIIRSNLSISTNSNIFYNIRRDVLKQEKIENLDSLTEHLKKIKNFEFILHKSDDGNFKSLTAIHLKVSESSYWNDIVNVDDTAGTNIYNIPLMMMVTIDQDLHTQILAYGFLPDKTQESFQLFFQDVRKITQKPIRAIIMDRCAAQFNAAKVIYPESTIGFCLIHIQRNLETLNNIEIMQLFFNMKFDNNYCEKFIDYLKQLIISNENKEKNGINMLKILVQTRNHWLPIDMELQGLCKEFLNTSRVECIFSKFKTNYMFSNMNIINASKRLCNFANILIIESINHIDSDWRYYYDENVPIFRNLNINKIGYFYIKYISKTYYDNLVSNNSETNVCCWCVLRNKYPMFSIPCAHILQNIENISLRDIPLRFIRNVSGEKIGNVGIIEANQNKYKNDYSTIMARISPYASLAHKNEEIMKLFDEFFDKIDMIKTQINDGMPLTIAQQGQSVKKVSKNVILGNKQKTTRVYKCSNCGSTKHNYRKCPYK